MSYSTADLVLLAVAILLAVPMLVFSVECLLASVWRRNVSLASPSTLPRVDVIIPAHNEEQEIEALKVKWQQQANEIFGPGGRAENRNADLTKPLLDKINVALEQLALENGYDLILDAVNGNIAYGKKDLDITDRVLEELEKTE